MLMMEFFGAGIVMVESCCNGAVINGVMLDISKMVPAAFAVRLDVFAGSTASTISGVMSSDFFRPEYLMRGCDVVFGTVANSN